MQQCGNCGHTNRSGVVFCENCGASLIGRIPLSTKALDSASEAGSGEIGSDLPSSQDIAKGMATFMPGDSLKLDVEGAAEPMVLEPKAETILGRRDPATGATPDIDLTPFAGYRMGVSRRHAAIRHGDDHTLNIWDLGSSNGTFLNGQRLNAHRPYRLHDGDELRLGQMVLRLYFKPVPASARPKAVPPAPARETAPKSASGEKPKPQPSPPRAALTPPLTVVAPQAQPPKAAEKSPTLPVPPQPSRPAEEAPAVPPPSQPAKPVAPAPAEHPEAAQKPPVVPTMEQPEVPAASPTPQPEAQSAPIAPVAPKAVPEAEIAPPAPEGAPPADTAPPAPAPQAPAAAATPVAPAEQPAESPAPAPKASPPAEAAVPTAKNGKPAGSAPFPSGQQADRPKTGEDDATS